MYARYFLRYLSILVYLSAVLKRYHHSGTVTAFLRTSSTLQRALLLFPILRCRYPSDGSSLASINVTLGLFASFLGNMSAVTYGRHSKRTVAIQCHGGSSLGDLFAFDGRLEPSDRYEGRKLAFGADVEILKANRQGATTHQELDTTGCMRRRRRPIWTFYLSAQKLVFHNSDFNTSTTVCKVGDLEVSPKAFLDFETHTRP